MLDGVRLPDAARLPEARGLKAPLSCLTEARHGIVWGALGAARDCLTTTLDYAVSRGVIPVAAAGNQGMLGSTAITRHSWVLPVVACDLQGKPMNQSNLGRSLGRRGSVPAHG